jgi:ABC-type Fe3+ transport system substrate-binding protein
MDGAVRLRAVAMIAIARWSEHKAEAADFARYMASPEVQTKYFAQMGELARSSPMTAAQMDMRARRRAVDAGTLRPIDVETASAIRG